MPDRSAPRTLLGTVKDEGPYLLEWICYYKLIGFDRIVLASNDCADGTRQMLDYLHEANEITHVENSVPAPGENPDPQNRAYDRFWADETIRASEWVLVADADEFLDIRVGDGFEPKGNSIFIVGFGTPTSTTVPARSRASKHCL